MYDPDPLFVSLVKHGANQRPFHAVKTHTMEAPMPNTDQTPKQASAVKLHRIVFAGDGFVDEASVTKFMTGKGYTDFAVVKQDDGSFYVEDAPEAEIDGALRSVESPTHKGVTYVVGNPVAAVAKTEEGSDNAGADGADTLADGDAAADDTPAPGATEDAAKGADAPIDQPIRKRERKGATILSVGGQSINAVVDACGNFEAFAADRGITAKSFADTVAEYTGGVPPGMWSLTDAMMTELRKLMKAGRADETRLNALTGDFVRGIMALNAAYATIIDATGDGTTTKSVEDEAAIDALLELLFAMPEAAQPEGTAKSAEQISAAPVAPLSEDPAMKAMMGQLAAMQKTLDTMAVVAMEASTKSDDTDTTTARIVPERKSADASEGTGEDNGETAEDVAAKRESERRALKRLGFAA
jgi:hypothetical protein